jgi:hypothetical protein
MPSPLNVHTTRLDAASEWNLENLHTHGVLQGPDPVFKYVLVSHPVIEVLRLNPSSVGVDIDLVPKVGGEYYRITPRVVDECCSSLIKNEMAFLAIKGICLNSSLRRLGDNDDVLRMILDHALH